MYRIDHTLSTEQNLVNLANTAALYPLKTGEFELNNLRNITPSAGNDFSNTAATLSGVPDSRLVGDTEVVYTRATVAAQRPTAGTRLTCLNADTHATILAKICERHRLVQEELIVTNPLHRPVGGQTLPYTVEARPGSQIYLNGGPLTIQVTNRDAFKSAPASYFFGAAVGEHNGQPVYLLPSTPLAEYSNSKIVKRQALLNLVNAKRLKTEALFRLDTINLGIPVAGSIEGQLGNTLVSFGPLGENTALDDGGYFLYTRHSAPQTGTLNPGGPNYAFYKSLTNALLWPGFIEKQNYPKDEFSLVRVISTVPSRVIEYLQNVPTYVVLPNSGDHTYTINN